MTIFTTKPTKKPLHRVRTVFLTLMLALQSTSHAGLFDDEEARKAILDLRQKVEANQQSMDKRVSTDVQSLRDDNVLLRKGLLDLQTLIEQLRADIAKQTGHNEQLNKDIADLQRRQRDLAQGVDDRMRKLEPIKVNPDGKEFLADPAEVREFDAALALFRRGDFKTAAQAQLDFLRRYPQSGYQSLGLFWLGNAQYANREYREAMANFKSSIDANPASSKAPEALLAMANCQIELKDTRAARKTLEDVVKNYPNAEAAIAAKDRLSRLK
jgi:tol-pal system protein YbgF